MKKNLFIWMFSLISVAGFCQFPIHTVMPMGVSGALFGDTLLNRQAVLQAAGVVKITVTETASGSRSYWTHVSTVADGKRVDRRSCFRRSPDSDSGFCIAKDTLSYDGGGRLQAYWAGGTPETAFIWCGVRYLPDDKAVYTWITKDAQRSKSDTDIYYYTYNAKGQLTRSEQKTGRFPAQASLYYGMDGLPDSIRNEYPEGTTYLFTRKDKGKNKELHLNTPTATYWWRYNREGQCLASYWSLKKKRAADKPLQAEVSYSYNGDGTLAKVIEKGRDRKTTVTYSYEKN